MSSVIYMNNIMDNLPQHPTLDPRKQELLEARFTGNQRVSNHLFFFLLCIFFD
jgi:hypothetical protein